MTERIVYISCPVCGSSDSQFNNGWSDDGREKIECGYCLSQYEVLTLADYRVTRAMKKNAEKIKQKEGIKNELQAV